MRAAHSLLPISRPIDKPTPEDPLADISVQLDVPSLAPPPTLRPRSRRRIAMAAVLWSVFLINAVVIIAL